MEIEIRQLLELGDLIEAEMRKVTEQAENLGYWNGFVVGAEQLRILLVIEGLPAPEAMKKIYAAALERVEAMKKLSESALGGVKNE